MANRRTAQGRRTRRAAAIAARRRKGRKKAVILFICALFLCAFILIEGNSFWKILHGAILGFFGACALLWPLLLIYLAIMAAMGRRRMHSGFKTGMLSVMVPLFSTAVTIFSEDTQASSYGGKLLELYALGSKNGGMVGGLLGIPLRAMLGDTGSKVVIILILFVVVMVLLRVSLMQLFKPLAPEEGAFTPELERRQRSHRETVDVQGFEGPRMNNIDISLGETTEKRTEEKRPGQIGWMSDDKKLEHLEAVLHEISSEKQKSSPPPEPVKEEPLPEALQRYYAKVMAAAKPAPQKVEKEHHEEEVKEEVVKQEQENNREEIWRRLSETAASQWKKENAPVVRVGDYLEETGKDPHWEESFLKKIEETSEAIKKLEPPVFVRREKVPEQSPEEPEKLEPRTQEVQEEREEAAVSGKSEPHREPVPPMVEQKQGYQFPPTSLLERGKEEDEGETREELQVNGQLLVDTLKSFGVQTKILDICRGPAVTRYELQPAAGVKISKITNLADDIAMNLAASGVRIEAPIPGKAAVGIEVPNRRVSVVRMRELIESSRFAVANSRLTVALGRDIAGSVIVADLAKMPHLRCV